MKKTTLGPLIIVFVTLVTIALYFLAKHNLRIILLTPFLSISQLLSLIGVSLLTTTFILSARFSFLENLFGGLDKVYKTHHLVSALSFILILNHPIFLIIDKLPNVKLALMYILPIGDISYNFGIFSLWLFTLLIIITIYINLPYQIWLKTHTLMGIPLFLASFHILLISSDVSRFLPLRIWIFFLLMIGILSYCYRVFLYKILGPRYVYVVDEIKRLVDITEVYMTPVVKKFNFRPGQFVFLNFQKEKNLKESHPFSIASSPNDPFIRICAKVVGDYTLNLRELKKGDQVVLQGPYGRLSEKFVSSEKDAVFIGGGIGITPFLSMVKLFTETKNDIRPQNPQNPLKPPPRNVYLFYAVSNKDESYYDSELSLYAQKSPSFHYFLHPSKDKGRLTVMGIKNIIGNLDNKIFFICGPAPMMDNISHQLVNVGVKRYNIQFEDFSLM